MKSYSISAKEVKMRRPNQYKLMVEEGPAISNWSTEHLPYSNKRIEEKLLEDILKEENK